MPDLRTSPELMTPRPDTETEETLSGLGLTLDEFVGERWGTDPNQQRNDFSPYVINDKTGEGEWAIPNAVYDPIKAFSIYDFVNQGGTPTDEDVSHGAASIGVGSQLAGLTRKLPANSLGQNVWQGGPNLIRSEPGFPQGRLNLAYANSGEGRGRAGAGEAKGWGAYTAQAKGTGEAYRRALSGTDSRDIPAKVNGVLLHPLRNFHLTDELVTDLGWDGLPKEVQKSAYEVIRHGVSKMGKGDPGDDFKEVAIKALDDIKARQDALAEKHIREGSRGTKKAFMNSMVSRQKEYDEVKKLLEKTNFEYTEQPGYLYKFDIPDDDIAKYLNWDTKLTEQTNLPIVEIKTALRKLLDDNMHEDGDNKWVVDFPGTEHRRTIAASGGTKEEALDYMIDVASGGNATGQDLYNKLSHYLGSKKRASQFLDEHGVPGNKFWDQESRHDPYDILINGTSVKHNMPRDENRARTYVQRFKGDLDKAIAHVEDQEALGHNMDETLNILNEWNLDPGGVEFVEDGTRNFVSWNQDVLDRSTLLQRNRDLMAPLIKNKSGGKTGVGKQLTTEQLREQLGLMGGET